MQEQLQSIKNNLDRLLRSYHAVKSENDILKSQLEAQRRGLHDKNKRIEELEKQFELLKTAQAIAHNDTPMDTDEGKSAMKKRINDLIKEVDNCIAQLNH